MHRRPRPRGAVPAPGLRRRGRAGRSPACTAATSVVRAASASSRWRRCARTSSLAVRKTLTGASGSTTVPMSRPSTTPPSCSATHARCRATSTDRTPGCDDTADTAPVTSGPRIAADTSRPPSRTSPSSSSTSAASATRVTASPSSRSTLASSAASVTARYMAPVSRVCSPSALATPRATVDFPEPAGPSIATTRAVPRRARHCSAGARPVKVSRSATNSGYDTAAARQPDTTDSPSTALPATAAAIAMR